MRTRNGTVLLWLGLLSFLAFDLALFGNCVMPTQDAAPEPVPEGKWQAGAIGTAALAIPFSGGVDLRRGLSGNRDWGVHAQFELLPDESSYLYSGDDGDSTGREFQGGETFALGLDRKHLLSRNGDWMSTFQYGLNLHRSVASHESYSADVMAGMLFGSKSFHIAPRLHVGWQNQVFAQAEMPIGLQAGFFEDRLRFGLGLNPAIFLAQGVPAFPWPWQYASLSWRFGG